MFFYSRSSQQSAVTNYFNPSRRHIHRHQDVNLKRQRVGPQTMITNYFKPHPKFKPTGNVSWTNLGNEAINPVWLLEWKKHTRIPTDSLRKNAVLNYLEVKRAGRELARLKIKYDGPVLPHFSMQIRVMRNK